MLGLVVLPVGIAAAAGAAGAVGAAGAAEGPRHLHELFYTHEHSYDELIREIEHHEEEYHRHDELEIFAPPLNHGGTVLKGEIIRAGMPPGDHPKPLSRRKERAEVHRDGDWHRFVNVWLTDGEGNLLLRMRDKHKLRNPAKWDVSAAGHVVGATHGDRWAHQTHKPL